jgi:hypothetical protein
MDKALFFSPYALCSMLLAPALTLNSGKNIRIKGLSHVYQEDMEPNALF